MNNELITQCFECAYWEQYGEREQGRCLRFAPGRAVGVRHEDDPSSLYEWPMTLFDDRCGEGVVDTKGT